MAPELVLASTSRYRLELLARLGVPFRAVAHRCDERALERTLPAGASPTDLAVALARAKAESLRDVEPHAAVLGSDQVAALGAEVLHKPGTPEEAARQLTRLAGRTHLQVTAVALLYEGCLHEHVDVARLTMRPLTAEQIERYVSADAPLDCAGSYRLEARGITLFERIECADHTAIVGLPLIAVTSLLAAAGYPLP
jgi:septum formation protein